jgi:cyclophilin family peptidyl-prolyl cis-trans isomerase
VRFSRRVRPWLLVALLGVVVIAVAACGGGDDEADTGTATTETTAGVCTDREPEANPDRPTYEEPPEQVIDPARSYRATIATSCGDIIVQLDPATAPIATNNFVFLAREGFYDGLTFHRVVPGFVIQGGDPAGDGTGGPGYTFEDELPDDGYPIGALARANAGPDTNGSQFFIVTGNASALPNAFTRFGRVVAGLEVAQTIEGLADADAPPGDPSAEQPSQPVYIFDVTIQET